MMTWKIKLDKNSCPYRLLNQTIEWECELRHLEFPFAKEQKEWFCNVENCPLYLMEAEE